MLKNGWGSLQTVTALAGASAIVAAFLPWVDARVQLLVIDATITVDGVDTDGRLTLFLGVCVVVAVLAGIYAGMPLRAASLAAAGFGAGILIVGALSLLDLEGVVDADNSELDSLPFVDARAQIGLWLTTASGVVATVGGLAGAAAGTAKPAAED